MHMYAHTPVKYSYNHACMHTDVCMHVQTLQTYILHPDMKIIKIKASDLYEKNNNNKYICIYATMRKIEQGKFWIFILPKSYLNPHTFIHMHCQNQSNGSSFIRNHIYNSVRASEESF